MSIVISKFITDFIKICPFASRRRPADSTKKERNFPQIALLCIRLLKTFILFCYKSSFLCSASESGQRYFGATSNAVIAPVLPSLCMRYTARAYASRTLEVNSGLESSFNENSMRNLLPVSDLPERSTMPPCGMPLWFFCNSSSEMKCTVVS